MAAETGGKEVALPVLASTLTTAVVFFPVTLLSGVSKFLFSAMALAVVVSLFASYVVAMTVVPLFCARFLKLQNPEHLSELESGEARTLAGGRSGWASRFNEKFNAAFNRMLGCVRGDCSARPAHTRRRAVTLLRGVRSESVAISRSWASRISHKPTLASS